MKNNRGKRLSGEFQKEISSVISQKLRNKYPELSAIVSVTETDVAPDLKSARIYISIFDANDEKRLNSFEIIRQNAGFIRHELAMVMRLRTVPELRFVLDESMEHGAKIDKILENLDAKKDNE